MTTFRNLLIRGILLASVFLIGTHRVHASCNVIPSATPTYRSTLASLDRPFARPGDWVTMTVDPACHSTESSFGATADIAVTIVFTPPSGPRTAVVLRDDCSGFDGGTAQETCQATLGTGGRAFCIPTNVGDTDMFVVNARRLRFRFPDTDALLGLCSGGSNDGKVCRGTLDCGPGVACTEGQDDDVTLSGPATITVTSGGGLPACGDTCAGQTELAACADAFFTGGECGAAPDARFSHFTALPPPNDYQALCTDPSSVCTGLRDELRFTVDAAGNILLPMGWHGVLVRRDAVPVPRLLRATSTIEAFAGGGRPIVIPDVSTLASYSPEGVKLPPLFDPQRDPNAADEVRFFGSADAPETVLRIARHDLPGRQCVGGDAAGLACANDAQCPAGTCGAATCTAGPKAGVPCSDDADCPGAVCGPPLFDFSTRLVAGVGPVVLRLGACLGGTNTLTACTDDDACPGGQCGAFSLAALDPVPLDGLTQSADVNAFVLEEAIENVDFNGDGDTTDHVIKLGDRKTGAVRTIGTNGAEGVATVRVSRPPFSFPAVAVEGDVLAFLESEPAQGPVGTDENGNGAVVDSILRVFRLGGNEVTSGAGRPVEPGPEVDAQALLVSGGKVFFRTAEATLAHRATTQASVASNGTQANDIVSQPYFGANLPAVSADGRYVAFVSSATNLVAGDTNGFSDIFVHDRTTGTTGLVSVSSSGTQANGTVNITSNALGALAISGDGRFVAWTSIASNLVSGDTNGFVDVFVRDRLANTTDRVSIASDGSQGNDHARNYTAISADGRYVAFGSDATNLVAGDTNSAADIFVRDRLTGTTERVSVASGGTQASFINAPTGFGYSNTSVLPDLSSDGRYVVFVSTATNLVPGDTNGCGDVFVHDRNTGITERLSVASDGTQGNGFSGITTFTMGHRPSISSDGRLIAFNSLASNLVAGDTNGFRDIFVHDRLTRRTERINIASNGTQADNLSYNTAISGDGRFVAFGSVAANLVAGNTNGKVHVFVRDRLTGSVERASAASDGTQANDSSASGIIPAISGDGRVVALVDSATNLVAGDTNGVADIFVRAPALTDTSADVSGDGDLGDTVLRVLDATTGALLGPSCPADSVAVAGGTAVFLRPEASGRAIGCPGGDPPGSAPDLNGDGNITDDVVQLWSEGTVVNLGLAAQAVSLSNDWIAALSSEPGLGGFPTVAVRPISGGNWLPIPQAADTVDVNGSVVAFTTPEAAGGVSLNGDGDPLDRVLQVYRADTAALTNVGQAAEEFVAGDGGLVAFRTLESAQNNQILNGDADTTDGVLQIYDSVSGALMNTHLAVTPCRLEACDPRVPYRVLRDTVRFLTFECDQGGSNFIGCPAGGTDLNSDGDADDLVVQVLNVRQACHLGPMPACHVLASAPTGVCTTTGQPCFQDSGCSGGKCFLPPGGCIRDFGTACSPTAANPCPAGQYCSPTLGTSNQGTCQQVVGTCRVQTDCTTPSTVCRVGNQDFNRLVDPLTVRNGGAAVFTGAGHCVETFGNACTLGTDCATGEYCEDGVCHRDHGACRTSDDCPPSATCEADLMVQTAEDQDADEIPDAFDNCPTLSNVNQADTDGDGTGDACSSSCIPITDPSARVTVSGKNGLVNAKLVLALPDGYGTQPIGVKLGDTDTPVIALQAVGTLPSKGKAGIQWQFRRKGNGVSHVTLKSLGTKSPGMFRMAVKGKHWFAATQADQPAAGTTLTISVGGQCFTHAVTKKSP